MTLAVAAFLTILVNVPFGWWREGTRKFSPAWFVAVHGAVPFVIAIRLFLGIRVGWDTIPFLVLSYFVGQTAGARLRRRRAGSGAEGSGVEAAPVADEGWTSRPGNA